jgi:Fe-S cluster assembly ATP-binding protein
MSEKQKRSTKSEVLFACEDVKVEIAGKEVVRGVSLELHAGEKIALMGPNGSGKSSLANALMGHPNYKITAGRVLLRGEDITGADPDQRARQGLFLAFQYPVAVPGVSVANFLRAAVNAKRSQEIPIKEFRKMLMANFELLEIDPGFAGRSLNDGFSGGEKKRLEILQMLMLEPAVALLDETDSGLDIDALRIVAEGINRAAKDNVGVLAVTHYQRLLNYVTPDIVHVFMEGQIVRTGGPELALALEDQGYDWIEKELLASREVH